MSLFLLFFFIEVFPKVNKSYVDDGPFVGILSLKLPDIIQIETQILSIIPIINIILRTSSGGKMLHGWSWPQNMPQLLQFKITVIAVQWFGVKIFRYQLSCTKNVVFYTVLLSNILSDKFTLVKLIGWSPWPISIVIPCLMTVSWW